MTINERIKMVFSFLIREGKGKNQEDIGVKIGYYNNSYVSQVINGHVKVANKFINSLCKLDENINKDWVISGKGGMLKNEKEEHNSPAADQIIIALNKIIALQDEGNKLNKDIYEMKEEIQELTKENIALRKEVYDLKAQNNELKKNFGKITA